MTDGPQRTMSDGDFMQNVLQAFANGFSLSLGPQPMAFADSFDPKPQVSPQSPAVVQRAGECQNLALETLPSEVRTRMHSYFSDIPASVIDTVILAMAPKTPLTFDRELELLRQIKWHSPAVIHFTNEALEKLRTLIQKVIEVGEDVVGLTCFFDASQDIRVIRTVLTICLAGNVNVARTSASQNSVDEYVIQLRTSYMGPAIINRRRFILSKMFGDNFSTTIQERLRVAAKEGRTSIEIQAHGPEKYALSNIDQWLLSEIFGKRSKKHQCCVKFCKKEGADVYLTLEITF